jgi:formate hydrogenlyase subunit 3/multisubunit Na+/H+ antiporter MnhD subunit
MSILAHPLLAPIWLPLLAGTLCLGLPRAAWRLCAVLGVGGSALTLGFAWPAFRLGEAQVQPAAWLALRIDGLSGFVLLAVAAFGVLVALYLVGYLRGRSGHGRYFGYLLWSLGLAGGAVLANDLLLLLGCWGGLAATLYLMIGLAGPAAADAARKSLMIVGGADAALLLAVALVWSATGTTRMDAGPMVLDSPSAHLAFLGFAVAALAKAGAWPLHTWVPDCGERADAPVSALLPASLDKLLGVYLLARCALDLFVLDAAVNALLMVLGALTVATAAMMALVQRDLKRLFAYSTVSQVGYIVLGIGTGTALGIAGALFHMLNHAIYKCCLFLCAGAVERAAGTTDLDRLGGLARSMPITFVACLVGALAIAGVPPLNGFASKWMIYQGLITGGGPGGGWWVPCLAAAMLGSALTLAAMVKVLHAVFLCAPAPGLAARAVREPPPSMVAPVVALAVLCVAFGVFAAALPLRWLVLPALPAQVPGSWWSGTATVLILVAIVAGAVLYALTMAAGKLRRTPTFVGGERLEETYIHGEARGAARHVAVTGVDFYRTIEGLPAIDRMYALARRRAFDVYTLGAACTAYLAGALRRAHGGVLPLYLTWFLVGLVAVLYVATGGGG